MKIENRAVGWGEERTPTFLNRSPVGRATPLSLPDITFDAWHYRVQKDAPDLH